MEPRSHLSAEELDSHDATASTEAAFQPTIKRATVSPNSQMVKEMQVILDHPCLPLRKHRLCAGLASAARGSDVLLQHRTSNQSVSLVPNLMEDCDYSPYS